MNNKMVHLIAYVLVIVGGLNWLIVGLFELNLVTMLLGMMPMFERVVYVLVGLAAVYLIFTYRPTGSAGRSAE